MDAYLAALAIPAGLRLISLDQDFRQFEPERLVLQLLQADVRPGDQP
jgi:predicted nucleic acid-binding protein